MLLFLSHTIDAVLLFLVPLRCEEDVAASCTDKQENIYEYVSRSSGDFLISATLSSLHFSVNGFPHLFNMLWQCARFWWWNVKFGLYIPTFQQQHTMTTSLCNMCWAQTESSASEQSDFARVQWQNPGGKFFYEISLGVCLYNRRISNQMQNNRCMSESLAAVVRSRVEKFLLFLVSISLFLLHNVTQELAHTSRGHVEKGAFIEQQVQPPLAVFFFGSFSAHTCSRKSRKEEEEGKQKMQKRKQREQTICTRDWIGE